MQHSFQIAASNNMIIKKVRLYYTVLKLAKLPTRFTYFCLLFVVIWTQGLLHIQILVRNLELQKMLMLDSVLSKILLGLMLPALLF
jgi:hypothetical protein